MGCSTICERDATVEFDSLYLIYLSSFCFAISLLISCRARRYRKGRCSIYFELRDAVFLSSILEVVLTTGCVYDLDGKGKRDKRKNKSQRGED
jgi:hypothetical protein